MSRQMAFLSNDFSLFDLALEACGSTLAGHKDAPYDGWGIGYYVEDRALVQKKPTSIEGRTDLAELVRDVRSHSVMAHLRRAIQGVASPENTQPFRFRNWLCAHIGEASFSPQGTEMLRQALPGFLQHNVRGDTDSEVALHFFFDFLRTHARIDRDIVAVDALLAAARDAVQTIVRINKASGEVRTPSLDMVFLSGRMMVAVAASTSTLATLRIGAMERFEAQLFADSPPKVQNYPHFRGIFLSFDPNDPERKWITAPPRSVIVVDEHLQVHTAPLDIDV